MDELNALYAAAIARDAAAITELEMEADILDKEGCTILHTESYYGNLERVRFILREFANKNLLEKLTMRREPALHLALIRRHTEVARIIIEAARRLPSSASDNDNTDVNDNPVSSFEAFLRRVDDELNSALHIAVKRGNLATAELLVQADPSYPWIQNNKGKTPFYMAAERGYAKLVKMMCTTCTAAQFNLDGPGGRVLTAFHAVIKNFAVKDEVTDVIQRIIHLYKTALKLENEGADEYALYRCFVRPTKIIGLAMILLV